MLERSLVFVDTSYLLASFYNSWEIGARAQLEIDLPEVVSVLGNMIQSQLDQPVQRQLWYDGIPESGPHRYQRALHTCDGVQLRAGQLIEWGERRTQKAVDTRLVADMVIAATRRQFSDIVLVSGDADMIPGVQEATATGIRVHLYGFGWDSMSSALRHVCDTTTVLDPREDFSECMQLQVLEGPLPPTVPVRSEQDQESENLDPSLLNSAVEEATETTEAAENTDGTHEKETFIEDSIAITSVEVRAEPQQKDHKDRDSEKSEDKKAKRQTQASESVPPDTAMVAHETPSESDVETEVLKTTQGPRPAPNPSMMAPRRKLRSRYVPLPNEVWTSAGFQTPFDVGQQYACWWYENAANNEQRDQAHLLSGGGLPPEVDRPLLQFACETLHEYTLTDAQRVSLRDGFHSGIRGVLVNLNKRV